MTHSTHLRAWNSITPDTHKTQLMVPPPSNWYKFNFDAALRNDHTSLADVCSRDSSGTIIKLAQQKKLQLTLPGPKPKLATLQFQQAQKKRLHPLSI